MSIAFVFPGQGSQEVGMGRALAQSFAAAREVFDEVDDALGQKLSVLMWEGPEDELTLTENTQPAILTCSSSRSFLRRMSRVNLPSQVRIFRSQRSPCA